MSILPPMFTSLHFSSSVSLGCVVGIACAIWPRLALREQSSRRRRAMLREFPFLLDMTTLCVEAGLNLNGALAQAAKHRSEEHTSELQSPMRISYAVFCLKKKKTHTEQTKNEIMS